VLASTESNRVYRQAQNRKDAVPAAQLHNRDERNSSVNCCHNSYRLPVAGDSVRSKSVELFQPITMCRYFENASLPSSVTRTARDFRMGTIQPSSEYRLHILTPKIPARWGLRSVQSGH
jgi:hypothetical protein